MSLRRHTLWAALALILVGCAAAPPPRTPEQQRLVEQHWQQRRNNLADLNRFLIQARLAYGGTLGAKADLRWEQKASGRFELRLSGPFGVGAATITGTRQRVVVRTRDGDFDTDDPEGWIAERMGWSFPINHLRYWVLGLPAPRDESSITLNDDGQAQTLDQAGWHLEYTEYQAAQGYALPRKFEATHDNDVSLKIVIDDWSDLPPLPNTP